MNRSKAYKKYSKTMNRAWIMAGLRYGLIENEVSIGNMSAGDYDDLGRASVVLSVAAMDSYFIDAFIEKLIPFLKTKKPTPELIRRLEGAGFGIKDALELLHVKKPYNRIKKVLELNLEKYVAQSVYNINKLFLAYRLKKICSLAERKCKSTTLIAQVEKLVKRRHEIVHDGDYTKSGKLRVYNQNQITKQVRCMDKLVNACDEILFP